MSAPENTLYALSSTCTAAIQATGGQVLRAIGRGCAPEDTEAHFPPGGRCYVCLYADGDDGRCVSTGACQPMMNREMTFHIRREGDTNTTYYRDRMFFASSAEIDGPTFSAVKLLPGTLAEVSGGIWGYNPETLRPDGEDPSVVDHTRAREWLGAVALKNSTRINGVRVAHYNRNVCPDSDWVGRDSKARYFCRTDSFIDLPDAPGWRYDWGSFQRQDDPEIVEVYPRLTLAATGFMDPKILGGHLPHILGSATLADPEWENCRWPDQFEPDETANIDTLRITGYNITTQTYRFRKDPNVDIRIVMGANWRRNFCFEAIPNL